MLLLYEALDILQTDQKFPLDLEVNNLMLFQVTTRIKKDTTCMESIILCLFKLPVSLNDLPHSLHVCDCTLMYTYLLKAKLHNVERHETSSEVPNRYPLETVHHTHRSCELLCT